MKVAVEKQDDTLAKINLDIPADYVTQEYNKACKRFSQKLNVPGFRRGKIPRNIVEKTVGVERLKQEVLDRLLPHAFADAISENQLDIVAYPQIENYKFDFSEGIQVTAQVELRPPVTLPESMNFNVEVPEFKVPEDSEEKELQSLVERMTTLEPVIDRATEATDIASIDFAGSVFGEPIRGGSAKNYRIDISNNNFIEGFSEQLVGHRIGEEFTINVTFPQDYHDNALQGKPAEFKVKINDISKKVVPELTDDLAKKVGPYQSVDELRAAIRKLLDESAEQENSFRKQQKLIDTVVERSDVNIPDSMINREAKILLEEVQNRFKSQGQSWEQFLDAQGHETIWENLRQEAKKRIKTSLVLGAIAKQEALGVTEDEFTEYVRDLSRMRGLDEKAIMRQLANHAESTQAMTDQILSQKVVDFLMEKASFTMVDDQPQAEEGKASEAAQPSAVATAIEGEEFEVIADE